MLRPNFGAITAQINYDIDYTGPIIMCQTLIHESTKNFTWERGVVNGGLNCTYVNYRFLAVFFCGNLLLKLRIFFIARPGPTKAGR
jgi:hypothetical protein